MSPNLSRGSVSFRYYLDQASQFVTVTDNVAYDVKCAGFLQNFGLNCTITNNVRTP